MATVDGLRLRRTLGREEWLPPEPFGPDGWKCDARDGVRRVIVTTSDLPDTEGQEWTHASISHVSRMPSYDELCQLHAAVWGTDGYSYQVFAARSSHVNIHEHALHLWGRSDGARVLPDFGFLGRI